MNSKIRRLYKWKQGIKQGPVRIELHPTDRCNLDCRFCWRKGKYEVRPEKELKEQKLLEIVDEAAELGVKEWIVSGGGEPMVRKETTLKVMERIKEHGMWGQLTTNGTLFEEDDVKRLIKMGWDQVQISLQGPDSNSHNFITQRDFAFREAVKTSRLISDLKERYSSSKPFFGYNTIITNKNHEKLEEMIRLADWVGSQLVYFEPIYPGYNEVRLELNEKEERIMKEHIKKSKKLAEDLGVNTNVEEYLNRYSIDKDEFDERVIKPVRGKEDSFINVPCFQPWYLMGIKGSGISGCCSSFEEGVDIHDKSVRDVWFSGHFAKRREKMLQKDIPDYCSKCSVVVLKSNERIRDKLIGYAKNRTKKEIKNRIVDLKKSAEKILHRKLKAI